MIEKCDLNASYKRCASCPDKYHCQGWVAMDKAELAELYKSQPQGPALAELRKSQGPALPDIVKTISHIRGLKVEPDEDYIVHIVSNV